MTKVVFSGVQPTGDLHIGNYYGAIKRFRDFQNSDHEAFFCIVDLHALTVKHDPAKLRQQTIEIAAAYLACGVDPKVTAIFPQSAVTEHTEMAWFLSCVARMGWMERMHQFKDKTGDNKERASVGLFTYPILMAADILAYGADYVPVGDDQKQHIELAKDIAEKFNHDYKSKTLVVPRALPGVAPKIKSLKDASNKMSKSDPDPASRINLNDDADTISKKIRRATADTLPFPDELVDLKPEIENLITIYKAATGADDETIVREFGGKGYGVFKPALADALISEIEPIGLEMKRILDDDKEYLRTSLIRGAISASVHTSETMHKVRTDLGIVDLDNWDF